MQRNIKRVLSFEKPTNSRDAQKIFDRVNKKKTELDEKKRTIEITLQEKEEEISALQKMVDSLKREQVDINKQLKQNDYECGVIVAFVKKLIDQEQQNQYSDRCRQYLMDHCIWKNFDNDDDDDDDDTTYQIGSCPIDLDNIYDLQTDFDIILDEHEDEFMVWEENRKKQRDSIRLGESCRYKRKLSQWCIAETNH